MNAFFALRALLFAGELLAGSLPIMALAFLAASQKRASARHLTFAGAFAALLALPVLALIVPSPIRILLPAEPQQIPMDTLRDAASAAMLPGTAAGGMSVDPITIALALAALWLAGVVFVALRFAIGVWSLTRLRRDSRPFALAPENMPRVVATQRECELRLSHTDTGPITWGVFHPVILLPKTATLWPRERLHAVLLHELAHIRRRDTLTQTMSLAVSTLYWPSPLVWRGARALRREAEIAADDSAIIAGVAPSTYACELLGLAAEFRVREASLSTVSLFMAGHSALEARVKSVLAPTSLRSGVTPMDVVKITGFALVSATLIAFACPSLAQDLPPPPPSSPMVATPEAPPAPLLPPAPPTPAVVAIAAPQAPPAPPAPPSPPAPRIHAVTAGSHAAALSLRAQANELRKLRNIDWKRIRIDVAKARREAREALNRARPEIERAIAQVHASDAAMRAIEQAQPQIEAAMRGIGPTVQQALTKAREDLRKSHVDMKIEKSIDEALRRAQIKIDASDERGTNTVPDDSDESGNKNN